MPQKRAQRLQAKTAQKKTRIPTTNPDGADGSAPPEHERLKTQLDTMQAAVRGGPTPSVSAIAEERADPFRVLISTVISLRTKDEVTLAASERLFLLADTPQKLISCSEEEIAAAIYPAGFYRTKAANIREIGGILLERFHGSVPATEAELLELPGVGRKTANLVLGLGFGIPAICVDTHVHRIANRLGWVDARTPEQTEHELAAGVARELWTSLNAILVAFGQQLCTPTSPWCSRCPLAQECPKHGVTRSR